MKYSHLIPGFLRPSYIDAGRCFIQEPIFRDLLKDQTLSGACLNAGCGQMLYLNFLNAYSDVRCFVHMDLETPPSTAVFGNPRHVSVPGSVTSIPFPDAYFNLVFCTEVLEHVKDDKLAASEISRVLAPGGLALISTPTPPAPFDINHVREGYTIEEMRRLLNGCGLSVVKYTYAFHFFFRALYSVWSRTLRKGNYSSFPAFLMRSWSLLDAAIPVGKPWDIIVLAKKVE
jgi:SAM-dependent methyltransferase